MARFDNVLIGTGYVLEEVYTPIRYVVPDFRLNHALEKLNAQPLEQQDKVELLCNEGG